MPALFSVSTEQFRNRLAFFLITAFVAQVPLFVFVGIPENSKEVITYMMGQLSGMALMVLGHYFNKAAGQDVLDEKRAETTTSSFQAIKAVAEAGSTTERKNGE